MRTIRRLLARLTDRLDTRAQQLSLGPKTEGFDRAVLAFRAAGGSTTEMLVFARILATGRVSHDDRVLLGGMGINLRAGSGE